MQIATHAIGDRANDEIAALYRSLRVITASNSTNGTISGAVRRHRVEHSQHVSGPDTLEVLREAGVVAVTNPLHLMSDLDIIEARLGKGRAKPDLAFPSKALLQVCLFCSCQITSLKLRNLALSSLCYVLKMFTVAGIACSIFSSSSGLTPFPAHQLAL